MTNITIDWDNPEKTLIIIRYHANYSWDDLDAIVEQTHAMLRTVPHKVDIITVLNPQLKPPVGSDMMKRLRQVLAGMPDNLGLYVTVGRGNPFTHLVINSILQVFPSRHEMRSATNEEAGRELIVQYRAKQKA